MKVSAALLLCFLAASASLGRANIVEVAQGQPDLSTLVAAVQAAGLVDALAEPEVPLTVFAPTNDAFAEALASLGLTAADLFNQTDLLTEVLTYHVVPGVAAKSTDLTSGQVLPTLQGGNLTVSISPPDVFIIPAGGSPARVVLADVPADDAVGSIIHVIDRVLLPDI